MPVFVRNFNLIFSKEILAQKYKGGVSQFKIDHKVGKVERCQEDDELILVAYMNANDIDLDFFEEQGLHIQENPLASKDFGLVARYGGSYWEVDWLLSNETFAWHIDCKKWQKEKVEEICNLTMDVIEAEMQKGNNLFDTIKTEQKI